MLKTKLIIFILILSGISCTKSSPAPDNHGQPDINYVYFQGQNFPLTQHFVTVDSMPYQYSDYHVMEIKLIYFSPEFSIDYDQYGMNGGTGKGNVLVITFTDNVFPTKDSYYFINEWTLKNIESIIFYKGYDLATDDYDEEIDFDYIGNGFMHFKTQNATTNLFETELKAGDISGKFKGNHIVFKYL